MSKGKIEKLIRKQAKFSQNRLNKLKKMTKSKSKKSSLNPKAKLPECHKSKLKTTVKAKAKKDFCSLSQKPKKLNSRKENEANNFCLDNKTSNCLRNKKIVKRCSQTKLSSRKIKQNNFLTNKKHSLSKTRKKQVQQNKPCFTEKTEKLMKSRPILKQRLKIKKYVFLDEQGTDQIQKEAKVSVATVSLSTLPPQSLSFHQQTISSLPKNTSATFDEKSSLFASEKKVEITKEDPSASKKEISPIKSAEELSCPFDFKIDSQKTLGLSYNKIACSLKELNESAFGQRDHPDKNRLPSLPAISNEEPKLTLNANCSDQNEPQAIDQDNKKEESEAFLISEEAFNFLTDQTLIEKIRSKENEFLTGPFLKYLPKNFQHLFDLFLKLEKLLAQSDQKPFFFSSLTQKFLPEQVLTLEDFFRIQAIDKDLYAFDWSFNKKVSEFDLLIRPKFVQWPNPNNPIPRKTLDELKEGRLRIFSEKLARVLKEAFSAFYLEAKESPSFSLFKTFLSSPASIVKPAAFKPRPIIKKAG